MNCFSVFKINVKKVKELSYVMIQHTYITIYMDRFFSLQE